MLESKRDWLGLVIEVYGGGRSFRAQISQKRAQTSWQKRAIISLNTRKRTTRQNQLWGNINALEGGRQREEPLHPGATGR